MSAIEEVDYLKQILATQGHRFSKAEKKTYSVALDRWYYLFHLSRMPLDAAWEDFRLWSLSHWQRAMWASYEVVMGYFVTANSAVERIRRELPREHQHGRELEFSIEEFEDALQKYCPDNAGTVESWCEVFMKVPPEMLLYEDFFG